HSVELRVDEPFLSDDLVQRYLRDLCDAGLIRRVDDGAWALTCDLATTTLYDVYAACDYRLPAGAPLPGDLDAGATALLDASSIAVKSRLQVPLSEIFPAAARSNATVDSPAEDPS